MLDQINVVGLTVLAWRYGTGSKPQTVEQHMFVVYLITESTYNWEIFNIYSSKVLIFDVRLLSSKEIHRIWAASWYCGSRSIELNCGRHQCHQYQALERLTLSLSFLTLNIFLLVSRGCWNDWMITIIIFHLVE